jgi:hypothetical protein
VRAEVVDVFGVHLDCFSVGQETRPHGGPAGMIDLFLRNVGTAFQKLYSKSQSSYWSISFMQGVVSKTGGTEAGTLPKYRNDIKLISTL